MRTSFITALVLAFGLPALSLPTNSTIPPNEIRECWYFTGKNLTSFVEHIEILAGQLENSNNETLIPKMEGFQKFNYETDEECAQIAIQNWSCDHDLTVTGRGLAMALRSISQQCSPGYQGFGYYQDPDTGYNFHEHLWALINHCPTGNGGLVTTCDPGA
jgi:hypothetical protein